MRQDFFDELRVTGNSSHFQNKHGEDYDFAIDQIIYICHVSLQTAGQPALVNGHDNNSQNHSQIHT
jgi:hypothetical protein